MHPFAMTVSSLLLLSALGAQVPAPVATPAAPVAAPQDAAAKAAEAPVYDEKADARAMIAAAVAKARKENRRVLIQWGANWCGWCKWLAATMKTDGETRRKLMYEYDVVHIDVGRFDKNIDLARELGAEFKSIPYLTLLDSSGKALVQQPTEPFELKEADKKGNHHDPKKLVAWLTEHQATPLVAKDVRAAALAQAKQEGKRVFLHFGAPWCGWCHRLEDWMAEPAIAALLAKDFVDLKIDQDRMTGGKEMTESEIAAAGVKAGGIPWFVFLDTEGKQLAHSTGPKGNTGFPYKEEEIAHFATMLKSAKVHLTDKDIETLLASLNSIRIADEAKKKSAAGH